MYRKEKCICEQSEELPQDMIEDMLNKIMAANFSDLMKVTYLQIEKIHLSPKRLISINSISKYIVVK